MDLAVISDRPSDVSTEIGVGQEFRHRLIARTGDESDLKAGSSRVLHSWDAIRVVCRQGNQIHGAIGGKIRNIHADPHVDSLLFELGVKIGVGKRLARRIWYSVVIYDVAAEFEHAQPN